MEYFLTNDVYGTPMRQMRITERYARSLADITENLEQISAIDQISEVIWIDADYHKSRDVVFAFLKQHPELRALTIKYMRRSLQPLWDCSHFFNLTYLTMQNCNLRTLPNAINQCIKLEIIDISENAHLTRIEPRSLDVSFLEAVHYVMTPLAACISRVGNSKERMAMLRAYVKREFTYREARASTMTLLALARRKTGAFFGTPGLKDVTLYMIAPALYGKREDETWRVNSREKE